MLEARKPGDTNPQGIFSLDADFKTLTRLQECAGINVSVFLFTFPGA